MPADISVLTPTTARPDRMEWLLAAHASLHDNSRPFEHVLIVDGADATRLPVAVTSCPHTRVLAVPQPVGAAAARNLGLHRATGTYVTTLDDDDLLTPGSLDVRAAALDRGTVWVAGRLAHLHPDGTTIVWEQPAGTGPAPAGAVMAAWPDPAGTVPLGPTTVMTTRTLAQSLGGWAGLPTGEDLSLLAALTSIADGYLLDDVVYLYRSHAAQSLRTGPHRDLERTAREIAHARAAALQHGPSNGPPHP